MLYSSQEAKDFVNQEALLTIPRIKFIRIYGNYDYVYFSEKSVVDLYLNYYTYMT